MLFSDLWSHHTSKVTSSQEQCITQFGTHLCLMPVNWPPCQRSNYIHIIINPDYQIKYGTLNPYAPSIAQPYPALLISRHFTPLALCNAGAVRLHINQTAAAAALSTMYQCTAFQWRTFFLRREDLRRVKPLTQLSLFSFYPEAGAARYNKSARAQYNNMEKRIY